MGVLDGKTAFILGATAAIAEASARLLATDCATLFLMGGSMARLEAAKRNLLVKVPGARIVLREGDTENEDQVRQAAQGAFDINRRLDIVIGTVGRADMGMIVDIDLETFKRSLLINLTSDFLALRYAAPLMTRGGTFVFVSSTAAKLQYDACAPYCAGKAALEQLVRVAAVELAPRGIRVNTVRPGFTLSRTMEGSLSNKQFVDSSLAEIPMGRFGDPEEIAQGIRFLAGPESGWITGQSIAVDGGNELRAAPYDVTGTLGAK